MVVALVSVLAGRVSPRGMAWRHRQEIVADKARHELIYMLPSRAAGPREGSAPLWNTAELERPTPRPCFGQLLLVKCGIESLVSHESVLQGGEVCRIGARRQASQEMTGENNMAMPHPVVVLFVDSHIAPSREVVLKAVTQYRRKQAVPVPTSTGHPV